MRYRNVHIDNNYYVYIGYLTDRGLMGHQYPIHHYDFYHPQQYVNVNYINNVFYLSKGSLISLVKGATLDAFNFSGNTWAQNNHGIILIDDRQIGNRVELYYDENAEETIKRLTGDQTAIVLSLSFPPKGAPNLDSASGWARGGIQSAFEQGFIPADIQGDYKNVITRAEFCRMAVKWLEYRLGKNIDAS